VDLPDLAVPVVGCSRCRELEVENALLKGKLADWMQACEMAAESIRALRTALDILEAQAVNREARRKAARQRRQSSGAPARGRVVRMPREE
jgi:hypothetical protein